MTFTALASVALLQAANPDPGPPPKNCDQFVAHYLELMEEQSRVDVDSTSTPHDPRPQHVREGEATQEVSRTADVIQDDVARACERANGSQYECVIMADTYGDLPSCEVRALPLPDADERRAIATRDTAPPPTPEERARGAAEVLPKYIQSGTISVEALGTGSGASLGERVAPESDVAKGGR